ncbi:uncharacterized protein DMAD_02867 [Drosophila madeirensis]|uniref:Uncharacterized protein n=1 Tax=Drosophila madeirensis TaxID=30013 RepID=A0AAU9G822_DROMD
MQPSNSSGNTEKISSCGSKSRLETLEAAGKSGTCPCPGGQDVCICTNGICMKDKCPDGVCQRNHQEPPPSV